MILIQIIEQYIYIHKKERQDNSVFYSVEENNYELGLRTIKI